MLSPENLELKKQMIGKGDNKKTEIKGEAAANPIPSNPNQNFGGDYRLGEAEHDFTKNKDIKKINNGAENGDMEKITNAQKVKGEHGKFNRQFSPVLPVAGI